jgi:hypothetical protein
MTSIDSPRTTPSRTAPAPWARRAAHLVPLVTLPSGLWRIALVLGLPLMNAPAIPLSEKAGIVLLSVVSEGLALLTLGLVQPWGEVVPRWIPVLGGRRVAPLAATVPALLGAGALVVLWGVTFFNAATGDARTGFFSYFDALQSTVVVACYLPLLAWGPLLGAVAIDYYVRRTGTIAPSTPPGAPLTAERRPNRFAAAAAVAALVYAGLRLLWETSPPAVDLSPIGSDLVGPDGWAAIALCLAAAVVAGALILPPAHGPGRWTRFVAASAVSAALVAAGGPLLLLDVVGGLFPGSGVGFYPVGAVSRICCLAAGALLGLAVASEVQRLREACSECGRRLSRWTTSLSRTPRWAYAAAYISVAGFLTRVLAQVAVGFDGSPIPMDRSALLFETSMALAGVLLPLALVHRWGRWWPRWLVLGPAAFTSGGVIVYFGVLFGQMVGERLAGRNPFPPSSGLDFPEAFFWVAVPAYLVWGFGMAVAALTYFRTTRRQCLSCGS